MLIAGHDVRRVKHRISIFRKFDEKIMYGAIGGHNFGKRKGTIGLGTMLFYHRNGGI
jgi:hypothetical protein